MLTPSFTARYGLSSFPPSADGKTIRMSLSNFVGSVLAKERSPSMPQRQRGSILWKKTGRPKGGPVEDFATFLGEFYVETTKRPLSASPGPDPGEFKGPTIRFMRAALAPFPPGPNMELKPELGPELGPGLKSAGLRSLIMRVKARLKNSKS